MINLKFINKKINLLNNSKLFAGIAMLMLNIGSKYVPLNFSENQEGYLKNGLARQILIFSVAWMGSKDLVTAITLTAAFTVLAGFALNENSQFCVLPKRWQHVYDTIDADGDGIISEKELEKAIETLTKMKEKQRKSKTVRGFSKYYY
jgi:hypothetical protein